MSEHIAMLVRHLGHFDRTMSDVQQQFPALYDNFVQIIFRDKN